MTADWRVYAHGLRADAKLVAEGRSQYVDGRRLCHDCGCPSRHLEDSRCRACNERPAKDDEGK